MSYEVYARDISKRFLQNHEESERLLKFFFKMVSRDLAAGGRITFRGFGSFKRVKKKPRRYRNVQTGEIELRPAYKDVEFKPSKKLLDRI